MRVWCLVWLLGVPHNKLWNFKSLSAGDHDGCWWWGGVV